MGFPEDSSKPEIPNFDLPLITIDEDVVTLEVPVDHRGVTAMEIYQPFQNLPAPTLHRPDVDSPVF